MFANFILSFEPRLQDCLADETFVRINKCDIYTTFILCTLNLILKFGNTKSSIKILNIYELNNERNFISFNFEHFFNFTFYFLISVSLVSRF